MRFIDRYIPLAGTSAWSASGLQTINMPVRALALCGNLPKQSRLFVVRMSEADKLPYAGSYPPGAASTEMQRITRYEDVVSVIKPGEVLDLGDVSQEGIAYRYIYPMVSGQTASMALRYHLPRIRVWQDYVPPFSIVPYTAIPFYFALSTANMVAVSTLECSQISIGVCALSGGLFNGPPAGGDIPATAPTIGWYFVEEDWGPSTPTHQQHVISPDDQFVDVTGRGALSTSHYVETYSVPSGATGCVITPTGSTNLFFCAY